MNKDEDHHQLAGENRHHRTTYDAAYGYASRIIEEDKKGEFSRVDIALLGRCPHSLDFGVKVFKNCLFGGNNVSFSGKEVKITINWLERIDTTGPPVQPMIAGPGGVSGP